MNNYMSIDHPSLERVKAELGITLPEEYEQLVLDIPHDIPDAEECEISTDAQWLIQHNADLGADPAFFFDRKERWPDYFYVLGEDGNGNAFYLDLREGSAPAVYFLDHEQPDLDNVKAASSIQEWLTQVRAQLKESRANAASLEANERRRVRRRELARKVVKRVLWPFRRG
jgi:hypothetical protein